MNGAIPNDAWAGAASNVSALPDVKTLIPHRQDLLLIDRVVASDQAGRGTVVATLRPDAPYFAAGRFGSHWLIEIMAQAAGAIFSLQQSADDADPEHARAAGLPPKLGYLVAIDDYRFLSGPPPAVGNSLSVDVTMVHSFYPIGQYQARLTLNGILRAESTMKFMTDDQRSLPAEVSP